MFTMRLKEVAKLGEYDETYGQSYWCAESGSDTPVKFNSQNQEITVGDTIECEEKSMKKSQKGTTYWQLKKVKVVQDSVEEKHADPSTDALDGPIVKRLERLESKIDSILNIVDVGVDIPEEEPDE